MRLLFFFSCSLFICVVPHELAARSNEIEWIQWSEKDKEQSKRLQQPILLLVYDHDTKFANNELIFWERDLLPRFEVRKAFENKRFNFVKLKLNARGWPPQIMSAAKGGVVVLLMTSDAEPIRGYNWFKDNRPTRAEFVNAINDVARIEQARRAERIREIEKAFETSGETSAKEREEASYERKPETPGMIPGLGVSNDKVRGERKRELNEVD